MLKYPGCESECDPEFDEVCEECKPKPKAVKLGESNADSEENRRVFYRSCCQSNHEPLRGYTCTPSYSHGRGEDGEGGGGSDSEDKKCSFWRPIKCFREKKSAAADHNTSVYATFALLGISLLASVL